MARAILIMLVAMSLIPMGDSAGKLLVARHGFHPFFLAWSRFTLGALILVPFLTRGQFNPRLMLDWRVWLRGGLIVGGISSILTALQTEPLPNVFGAFFVGPILSFSLSAILLREPVTKAQVAFLLLGFGGVLLVVKPGFGMTAGLGFAVLAGVFYGSFLTASRWLAGVAPARGLLMSQLLVGTVILAPLGMPHFPEFTVTLTGLTLFSALASMAGNFLLVMAFGLAPASKLAPFVYFQLIAATGLGWAVFGDLPDGLAVSGLAVLVISGFGSALIRPKRL